MNLKETLRKRKSFVVFCASYSVFLAIGMTMRHELTLPNFIVNLGWFVLGIAIAETISWILLEGHGYNSLHMLRNFGSHIWKHQCKRCGLNFFFHRCLKVHVTIHHSKELAKFGSNAWQEYEKTVWVG